MLLLLGGCVEEDRDDDGGGTRNPFADGTQGSDPCPAANMIQDAYGQCVCRRGYVAVGNECVMETLDRVHDSTGTSWTILVYMVADNNLESAGMADLTEMMQVGASPSFNIVVQADRALRYDETGVGSLGNWSSVKRLHVTQGSLVELGDLGELNMGDPAVLADFIQYGVTTFPADRTALILWDHGSSWTGFGGDESSPTQDMLTLDELAGGFEAGLAAAGLDEFDLIGFDACLMSTYETFMALYAYGEYLLASEELEPGHGWNYSYLVSTRQDPSRSTTLVGQDLIDGFEGHGVTEGSAVSLTLSLLDLYEAGNLHLAVTELATRLEAGLATELEAVLRSRLDTITFGGSPFSELDFNMIDLGRFAANLQERSPALTQAAGGVSAALQRAVVDNLVGATKSNATGLSIYFPLYASDFATPYTTLPLDSSWAEFLTTFYAYLTYVGVTPPAFQNADHLAAVTVDATAGTVVQGQLAPGSASGVTEADLFYSVFDPASGLYLSLGSLPAEVDAGTGVVWSSWDGTVVMLSQGTSSTLAYLELSFTDSYFEATVPLLHVDQGTGEENFAMLQYILDEVGNVVGETLYVVTDQGIGELPPYAGSLLYPLLQVTDGSTGQSEWVPATDVPIAADQPFDLELVSILSILDPGSAIELQLVVMDYLGNGDYIYYEESI